MVRMTLLQKMADIEWVSEAPTNFSVSASFQYFDEWTNSVLISPCNYNDSTFTDELQVQSIGGYFRENSIRSPAWGISNSQRPCCCKELAS